MGGGAGGRERERGEGGFRSTAPLPGTRISCRPLPRHVTKERHYSELQEAQYGTHSFIVYFR